MIMAFFYTKFSTLSFSFEVRVAESGRPKNMASGRFSLYDQVETETETE